MLLTPRLELRPLTFAAARALERGPTAVVEWLGTPVAPGFFDGEFVPAAVRAIPELAADRGLADWTRLIVERNSGWLVGSVGYLLRPRPDGLVELGFEICPDYRRRGYAIEASRAMLDWAFARPETSRVAAVCFDDNLPSAGLLFKLGFRRTTTDGCLWFWELTRGDHDRRREDA